MAALSSTTFASGTSRTRLRSLLVPAFLRFKPLRFARLQRQQRLFETILSDCPVCRVSHWDLCAVCDPAAVPGHPQLTAILFRTSLVGVVASMLILAPVALGFTLAGQGPFITAARAATRPMPLLLAQVFLMFVFASMVLIASLLDERQQLQAAVTTNDDIYRLIANNSGDMIFVSDATGAFRYISPVALDLLELPRNALDEFNWRHVHPRTSTRSPECSVDCTMAEAEAACTYRIRHGDGRYRWFESHCRLSEGKRTRRDSAGGRHHARCGGGGGGPPSSVASSSETINAELTSAAGTDTLTGLANRRRYNESRRLIWQRARRTRGHLALLIIDIDSFKDYNDNYGHEQGDACLRLVAHAIESALRSSDDLVARYGGEIPCPAP